MTISRVKFIDIIESEDNKLHAGTENDTSTRLEVMTRKKFLDRCSNIKVKLSYGHKEESARMIASYLGNLLYSDPNFSLRINEGRDIEFTPSEFFTLFNLVNTLYSDIIFRGASKDGK